MRKYIYINFFSHFSKQDVATAGGKGSSLGELTKAGVPVPPGFVVLASAFDHFLVHSPSMIKEKTSNLCLSIEAELKRVNYDDINSVDRASKVIRDMIHDAHFPEDLKKKVISAFKKLRSPLVAVRSSATAEDSEVASWAGELETYLNTTEKNLVENIKKCWSSLYTPRAIFYRSEKRLLEAEVSVAVVVQKMIQSEVSGICFTVHPVTEDKNQMIIEACWGLGEAIVSGSVTPDSYILQKQRNTSPVILDIHVSEQAKQIVRSTKGTEWKPTPKAKKNKQKLSKPQIAKLAELCLRIEKHYRKPQDIEWVFAKGRFYILQSRPITTLR